MISPYNDCASSFANCRSFATSNKVLLKALTLGMKLNDASILNNLISLIQEISFA